MSARTLPCAAPPLRAALRLRQRRCVCAAAAAAAAAAKPQQPPRSASLRLPPTVCRSAAAAPHAPRSRRLRPCRAAAGGGESNAPWWTVRACVRGSSFDTPLHARLSHKRSHACLLRAVQSLEELFVLTFNPGTEEEGIYTVSSRDGASPACALCCAAAVDAQT
jgi:hypothetical protein